MLQELIYCDILIRSEKKLHFRCDIFVSLLVRVRVRQLFRLLFRKSLLRPCTSVLSLTFDFLSHYLCNVSLHYRKLVCSAYLAVRSED